jgi:hypothetical protein
VAGAYGVTTSKSGYYNFSSGGNCYYAAKGNVTVTANQTASYQSAAFPYIRLWPRGYGTITGRVVDAGNSMPVVGATVTLGYVQDCNWTQKTRTTSSTGTFSFTNVPESWPAPGVSADAYYNRSPLKWELQATHSSYNDGDLIENITLNSGESKNMGDISLSPKWGA